MSPSTRLLNLGCGATFHPEWVNVDASPASPDVIAHDLRSTLPFPGGSFDAAYLSHVLEHLEANAAMRLLRDCHRILKPGGLVRIVVPDLETIAKLYLESLTGATTGDADATFRYDWAMLELYDQTVRNESGGRMAACIAQQRDGRRSRFIESRIGTEAMRPALYPPSGGLRVLGWFTLRRVRAAVRKLRRAAAEASAFLFLGPQGAAALRDGLFRRSGEVHQWMYDRFSLKRTLEEAGFGEVHICAAGKSGIPDFTRFALELQNGRPRKPDSIYVEGRKPVAT